MKTHTPGPWKSYENYPEIIEFSTPGDGDFGGMRIAVNGVNYKTGLPVDDVEQAANMRLIAAAPDLLDALKKFVGYHDGSVGDWHMEKFALPEARAAIEKALTQGVTSC